ncbi:MULTISPECIES: hypothetical protein [Rahnella]|uniref:hypothetical protein n=1 Tax=Rahnella TaxID=34037 RepID=UPI003F6DC848
MKKLTLEKAQELLEFLKGKAANGDITISQENYLQAIELAVMVLNAQEDAEKYGTGFVACFSGGEVKKGDPEKVRISFTDSGLGYFSQARGGESASVIPEGYALVPIEPTEHMVVNGFESEPDKFFSPSDVWEEYKAMSGCSQAAHRAKLCWAAMVAAAPKPEAP